MTNTLFFIRLVNFSMVCWSFTTVIVTLNTVLFQTDLELIKFSLSSRWQGNIVHYRLRYKCIRSVFKNLILT
jgi:hypothetical protein